MEELRNLPLVARRLHHDQDNKIDWLLRKGELVRMLPGVHKWKDIEETFELRVAAVSLWQPDAVLLGQTAARLSWWPDLPHEQIIAAAMNHRTVAPWLTIRRGTVSPELVKEKDGLRLANTEHSILGMSADGDENAICEGLRRGATTIARLNECVREFPGGVRGARVRDSLLRESRDNPWSPLERRAHSALREARLTGWKANFPVVIAGRKYYLDAAFPAERIAIECDGLTHHGRDQLESDLERQNALVRAGWTVFRFTWNTVERIVETIAPVLRQRRTSWGRRQLPPSIIGLDDARFAAVSDVADPEDVA